MLQCLAGSVASDGSIRRSDDEDDDEEDDDDSTVTEPKDAKITVYFRTASSS